MSECDPYEFPPLIDKFLSNNEIPNVANEVKEVLPEQEQSENTSESQVPYGRRRSCWKKNKKLDSTNECKTTAEAGIITCGICGVKRFYKFMRQTKKYGLNSCEPCRKFISSMVQNANNGNDLSLICKGSKNCMNAEQQNSIKNSKKKASLANSRCRFCWLSQCLKNYEMPVVLKKSLDKFLINNDNSISSQQSNDNIIKCDEESSNPKKAELEKDLNESTCMKILCKEYMKRTGLKKTLIDQNTIVIFKIND